MAGEVIFDNSATTADGKSGSNPLAIIAFRAIFCKMIRLAFLSIATCFNNFFLNLQFLPIVMKK
jgi:hypothetical protein